VGLNGVDPLIIDMPGEFEKMGIRIENNYLITDGAPVDLTARIPVKINDIENHMK